ncbi:Spy/CpxP family protein refolding chaperone [Candidatus Vondammii sp. HM_W22]|uniref:Spy/CpxP family protein refolding chaperone n=1 Tax=Candidatus Vondammii sp. HM_W22 TaxID=2687299 RepID=UPI001F136CE9|nr:Spy/CpxP family protein refolding chaperone [Candidatus Vondammii sp. HM_W22]
MRDLGNKMQDVRDDLRDSRTERESLDTIRALAEKQGDLVTRMIILRAETRDKTTNILTDAQQKHLTALSRPGDSLWRPYGKARYGQSFSPRHKMHRGSRCWY